MRKGTFHFRPSGPSCRSASWAIALAATAGLGLAHAQTRNPGYDRPGMGFAPAVLDAGAFTIEQGLPDVSEDRDGATTTRLYSADTLLRLGLGGPLELQLGSTPWNRLATPGGDLYGRGSSSLGLKFALPAGNPAWSWGLLGSMTFTDGSRAFRADRRQYMLGLEVNRQAGARQSLGLYLADARAAGDSSTLALSDTVSVTPTLSAYLQLATLHPSHAQAGQLAGAGLAWMATPRLQLDAGFNHRLAGSASRWQANLGASYYFGD
ncbi:transporter [Dyella ginsengisoli]|uniref:transporter n=1 Tax=Dyella ginsengisoli TaxID=363848 RepID=UPI0012FD6769|nr:transporter [Dyella ginsengisoli]